MPVSIGGACHHASARNANAANTLRPAEVTMSSLFYRKKSRSHAHHVGSHILIATLHVPHLCHFVVSGFVRAGNDIFPFSHFPKEGVQPKNNPSL